MSTKNVNHNLLSKEHSHKNLKAISNYPNLPYLAHIRRQISNQKSENVNLVRRELCCHHNSIIEYSYDHFNHLLELNSQNDKVSFSSNFALQPQINTKMRSLIFDFIMYSHTRLNLCTATLFLTFDILDRYASKFIVKSGNYQLLALTALWLSSKYWDAKHRIVNLVTLCQLCCNQYTEQNFKDMELHILKSLDWNLFQTTTYNSFIDMLLFLKNNELNDNTEKEEKFVISNILNTDLNINEVKLGAILLCELVSFDINLTSLHDTYSLTKAVLVLLTLSMNYQQFKKWGNLNDVCKDEELVSIMNSLLQICSNAKDFPSSFKVKHFSTNTDSKNRSNAAEIILQGISNYNSQLQAEEFVRLQQSDLFNDPFSNIFIESNTLFLNNDNEHITSTLSSTPAPGYITPSCSSSSSSYSKQIMDTPIMNAIEQSRSSSVSTVHGVAQYFSRNQPLFSPITPTTPTMFRKPSIRKLSTVSFKPVGSNLIHQRKRSSSNNDVHFDQYDNGIKR